MKRNSLLGALALFACATTVTATGLDAEIATGDGSQNHNIASVPGNYQFPGAPAGSNGILYNNGPLVTHPGAGPGGEDVSVLQDNTLGMDTLGFGHALGASFRIADDFTISTPYWDIDTITFYAYQTGEVASTITAVNLRIWDGPPGAPGSQVVFGDTSTNRLVSTVNSNILRATELSGPLRVNGGSYPNNRQIAATTVAVNIRLPQGTYWLDWQSDGSGASGPWAPPITVLGQASTGNGMQYDPNGNPSSNPNGGGIWTAALDSGSSTPQGFPFVINGSSVIPQIPANNRLGLWLLFISLGLMAMWALSRYRRV